MSINEERRIIAARLREKHDERQGTFEPQSMSIQAMNRMDDLLECLPKRRDMFLDLADLIEPENRTCKMTKKGPEYVLGNWWECSKCGPVYPPCNDEISTWALQYCPRCGAKVVN